MDGVALMLFRVLEVSAGVVVNGLGRSFSRRRWEEGDSGSWDSGLKSIEGASCSGGVCCVLCCGFAGGFVKKRYVSSSITPSPLCACSRAHHESVISS